MPQGLPLRRLPSSVEMRQSLLALAKALVALSRPPVSQEPSPASASRPLASSQSNSSSRCRHRVVSAPHSNQLPLEVPHLYSVFSPNSNPQAVAFSAKGQHPLGQEVSSDSNQVRHKANLAASMHPQQASNSLAFSARLLVSNLRWDSVNSSRFCDRQGIYLATDQRIVNHLTTSSKCDTTISQNLITNKI